MENQFKLKRLIDALVDNLINLSEEEFLKECEEDGIDVEKEANKVRKIIEDVKNKSK